ncbi:MAG: hypothetical protein KatS3mg087_1150 [Patescibacteria group bacterium]|nr:MAG: hypothetical protein KatS3mg087_1150 [Patescibacteria group bacterium]
MLASNNTRLWGQHLSFTTIMTTERNLLKRDTAGNVSIRIVTNGDCLVLEIGPAIYRIRAMDFCDIIDDFSRRNRSRLHNVGEPND